MRHEEFNDSCELLWKETVTKIMNAREGPRRALKESLFEFHDNHNHNNHCNIVIAMLVTIAIIGHLQNRRDRIH